MNKNNSELKNNVLVLASTFPRWKNDNATPPFVYELSKRLTDSFNIHILAPYSKNSKKEEILEWMNIHRFKYWFENEKNLADGAILPNLKSNKLFWIQVPFFLIFEFFSIIYLTKKYKIDVIHAHWIIPSGFLAVLYKKLFNKNVKILVTSHGGDIYGLKKFNFLKKWILKNCDSTTVVSNDIKNYIQKITVDKHPPIQVIPMGIDTELFNPDNYNNSLKEQYNISGKFLLFVGRLSEKKGINYLIDAMPKILSKFSDTKLIIIGNGELEQKLKKQASDLNLLNKNIIFTGSIPNIKLPSYYATADIFIGPSIIATTGDREGLPVSYMEALSSGCIVIATDLEGNKDIIQHLENGILVPQKNSDAISLKVIELLNNQDLTSNIKENSRNSVVQKFDWRVISEKYGKILQN
jgi:glycosyltransferase involved in cell wall biosynthesis